MDSTENYQAFSPVNLNEKYDLLGESWGRVDRAIKSGALAEIKPAFTVGRRRVYERRALDEALAERKFGPLLQRARAHRGDPSTTLPMHLSPPAPQPGVLPFQRAHQLAWQEHRALARLNKPPKKKRLMTAPPLQWCLTYDLDDDGDFELTGGIARTKGGDHE